MSELSDLQNAVTGTGSSAAYAPAPPARQNGMTGLLRNKAVVGVLSALVAGGGSYWLGQRGKPPAFDAVAYRRERGLVLLGVEQRAGGVMVHVGTLGTNGAQEVFALPVTVPPPTPQPAGGLPLAGPTNGVVK